MITAWLAALWAKIWKIVCIVAGVLLALGAAVLAGLSVGKSKQAAIDADQRSVDKEADAVRTANEERAANDTAKGAIKNAAEANAEVNNLDASGIASELRADWQRQDAAPGAADSDADRPK